MNLGKQLRISLFVGTFTGLLLSCISSVGVGSGSNNRPIVVGPILIPGNGFSGVTPEPGQTGSGDAKAIARWDVVPYQTITTETFNVGIVAFHIAGIDRVEFSLNGGPFAAVNTMALNTQVGVVEYFATIRRSDFTQDGPIELRAIAYPKAEKPQAEGTGNYSGGGYPRLLDSLFLYVDAEAQQPVNAAYVSPNGDDANNGSEADPVKTPWRAAQIVHQNGGSNSDGGIVYLAPGDYTFSQGSGVLPSVTNRWLTIRSKAGVPRSQVIVRGPWPGAGFPGLHLQEVTMRQDINGAAHNGDRLWLDHVTCQGNGIFTTSYGYQGWTGDWDQLYLTDIEIYDTKAGVPSNADLLRNAYADRVQTGIRFEKAAINVHYKTMYPEPGEHTDFLDYHWNLGAVTDNNIAYGIIGESIDAAGIVLASTVGLTNTALVNIAMNLVSVNYSWWGGGTDYLRHFLMYNVTHHGFFSWDIPQAQMENVSVRGSVFTSMGSSAGAVNPNWFDQNHYINTTGNNITPGTNATTGDPMFTGNFTPDPNSPLRNRLEPLLVPIDVNGATRSAPASIGAIE